MPFIASIANKPCTNCSQRNRFIKKVDPLITHNLLYQFDCSECFELMIRKNTILHTSGIKGLLCKQITPSNNTSFVVQFTAWIVMKKTMNNKPNDKNENDPQEYTSSGDDIIENENNNFQAVSI